MLHWFQKNLITEEAVHWFDHCAQWLIDRFDPTTFYQNTPLVTPDATFFPDPVSSPEEMASYVLRRVAEIAGVSHLPWQLTPVNLCQTEAPKILGVAADQRHLTPHSEYTFDGVFLQIAFQPEQIKKPQDLVASTAQQLAQHLLWQQQSTPPGGMDFFQQTAELLAIFLGFGIVMVNSAYNFRGSCAKCYDPRANRQANLSERETVYGLALFSALKNIPTKDITQHLKPHLKNDFKLALKQIKHSSTIGSPPSLPQTP